jgi:hypothetical protein
VKSKSVLDVGADLMEIRMIFGSEIVDSAHKLLIPYNWSCKRLMLDNYCSSPMCVDTFVILIRLIKKCERDGDTNYVCINGY